MLSLFYNWADRVNMERDMKSKIREGKTKNGNKLEWINDKCKQRCGRVQSGNGRLCE